MKETPQEERISLLESQIEILEKDNNRLKEHDFILENQRLKEETHQALLDLKEANDKIGELESKLQDKDDALNEIGRIAIAN